MLHIGIADYGMNVYYGEFYDFEDRLRAIKSIGYEGIERLRATDAMEKAAIAARLGMGYATRSCDHYTHAKMALEAGKSVLLEKPMCTCCKDAKAISELAAEKGLKLYIRHNRRWEGKFEQVSEIIASGILGDIHEIRLARNGFETRNDWQTLKKYGGGQMLNWGPHIVDHALRFGGGDYTQLFCETRQINASGDCEDHIKLVMNGKNGVTVDLEISSGVAMTVPEYVVYGSRGTLYDEDGKFRLHYIKPGCDVEKKPANEGTPENFFRAVPSGIEWVTEEIPCRGDDRLDAMWLAMADDFFGIKPYRIKMDEALKVIETIEEAKRIAGKQ